MHQDGIDKQGRPYGIGRVGTVPTQSLYDFALSVKQILGSNGIRLVDGGKPVHTVAVGGGSCGNMLQDAIAQGCDTFVTSDVKYNQFWDARDLGMTIIDAGHFYTENPVVKVLADKIAAAFPEIQVLSSKTHTDCAKFF